MIAFALAASAAACGAPPGGGTGTGTLAFVESNGNLVVSDLATGRRVVVQAPAGVATVPVLSLDGQQVVALPLEVPGTSDAPAFALDVGAAKLREIQKRSGIMALGPGSGFFLGSIYSGSPDVSNFVLPQTGSAARPIGSGYVFSPLASPYGPRFAYSECADGKGFDQVDVCPQRLVVDSAIDVAPKELARDGKYFVFGFTPDEKFVVAVEQVSSDYHLVRHEIASGGVLDLGPVDFDGFGSPGNWWGLGGSSISLDGREALVRRSGTLAAVSLDGTGTRTVATLAANDVVAAAFTPGGDVFYELLMTELSGGDVVVGRSSSVWRFHNGQPEQIAATSAVCAQSALSASGHTAARSCDDGIHVLSVDNATEIRTIFGADWPVTPQGAANFVRVLGIDSEDRGLVVAIDPTPATAAVASERQLVYFGMDGTRTDLGRANNTLGRGGAFDYRP